MPPQLLTLDEAAKVLRISRRSVQRLVEACKLPRCAVGRRTLFRVSDIERLINKSTR